jgi:hypothetical protein
MTKSTIETNFWFSSGPFFTTSLIVVPDRSFEHTYNLINSTEVNGSSDSSDSASNKDSQKAELSLNFYDAHGELFNSVSITVLSGSVETINLENYTLACKMQGGLKHGRVSVQHTASIKCLTAILPIPYTASQSLKRKNLIGDPLFLNPSKPIFFPFTINNEFSNILTVINCSQEEADFRCRLIVNDTFEEVTRKISGNGSSIISINADFHSFLCKEFDQAYLKISTKMSSPRLGFQFVQQVKITQIENSSIRSYYTSLNNSFSNISHSSFSQ